MSFPTGPAPSPPVGVPTPSVPGEQVFRLHRRSLVMPVISAVFIVVGALAVVFTDTSLDFRVFGIALGVVARIVQVVTTRVVVTNDRVRATWGWIWTSDKSIPLDRVQDVEIQRSLIARVLRLTQVEISSAGAGGSIKLSYFDLPDADRFRSLLVRAGLDSSATPTSGPGAGADTPGTIVAPGPGAGAPERALHAVSLLEIGRSVAVGTALALLAFVVGIVLAVLVHPAAILPGLALLAIVAVRSVGTWLTIGPGETSIRGDLLHTRQGVITLRNTNTPLRRIQILGAIAGPVYQLIGAEKVSFASADAAVASSERVRTQISPGAPRGLADSLVEPVLGVAPPTADRREPLTGAVIRSNAWREAIRWLRVTPVVALAGAIATTAAAAISDERTIALALAAATIVALVATPVVAAVAGAVAGWVRSRRSWIAIDEDCLVVHDGVWRLRTIAVPLAKVQAVEVTTDPGQRRCGTATIQVDIAGVSGRWAVRVADVDHERLLALGARIVPVATRVVLVDGV